MKRLLILLLISCPLYAQTYPTCGTVATTNASGVPTSGDTTAHAPPSYTSFTAPGIGGTWTDQQYGCTIEQLTAALSDGFPGGSPKTEHHFYINSPMNLSNNKIVIIDNNGSVYVLDTSGHRIITSGAFPNYANNGGSGIYWSRQPGTPNEIYYKRSSGGVLSLQKADTTSCTSSTPCSTLTFTQVFSQTCASWNTNNEDDMRSDGNGHDMVGWDCGTTYSVINASAGTQGTTFTNTNSVNNYKIGHNASNVMYMCLSMNAGTSGSGSAGVASQGTWCYNGSTGAQIGQATTSAQHANLVWDPTVSKLYWVQEQSGNEISAWNPCTGTITSGVEEIESANWGTATHVCLWNWPTPSPQGFCVQTHVSGSDQGVAGVEVYSGPTSCNSSPALFNPFASMDSNYVADWIPFYGDMLVLGTSNNKIYRVGQHRSRMNNGTTQDYWAEPRNALSIDATKIVFDSNQIQGCCTSPAYVANYSDVYMVSVLAAAQDLYYANVAAGSNNGSSCSNAYAYNDATHGLQVAANWLAGNTYHLCGTITIPVNTSGITVLANGNPVAPITLKFETGAILQSPRFPGGANGPAGPGCCTKAGGIVIPDGTKYVIVDGGTNGTIQNTSNGNTIITSIASGGTGYAVGNVVNIVQGGASGARLTVIAQTGGVVTSAILTTAGTGYTVASGLATTNVSGTGSGWTVNITAASAMANSNSSLGIYDGGDYTIIRNLTFQNIFQWPNGPANDNTGGMSADIWTNGAANYLKVCNNTMYSGQSGLQVQTANTISTSYTPSMETCSTQTFTNVPNIEISYNLMDDHGWMMVLNGSGIPIVHNNQMGTMLKQTTGTCTQGNCGWFNWTADRPDFHEDGLFLTGHSPSVFHPQIFWNLFEGDTSAISTTSGIYMSYVPGQDYGGQDAIYANVCYAPNQGAFTTSNQGNTFCHAFATDSVNINGPHKIYANDILGATNFGNNGSISTVGIDFQNNIYQSNNTTGSIGYFYGNGSGGQSFASNLNWNNNVYSGSRQAVVGPNGGFDTWASAPVGFATWQGATQCGGSAATGCDSASLFSTSRTYIAFQGQTLINSDANISDGSNFYLTVGSPARNMAANLTSQCTTLIGLCQGAPQFFGPNSTCGSGCVARPTSGLWDAGAYQFQTASWNPGKNGRDYLNGGKNGRSYTVGITNGRKYP